MKNTLRKLLLLVLGLSATLLWASTSQAELYFVCVYSYCSTRPASHPCWCSDDKLSTCGQGCGGPVGP